MSGYTPLFSTLTTGTLCGKWPDIGLWPIILSLCDRSGCVDVTPTYLAGVTGLPAEEIVACMQRFCQPDPYSRSKDENGARLALLDDHRAWGWRIVNHTQYREKARLAAKTAREVTEGKNKARMDDRRSPPLTASDPPSNSNSNSNSNSKSKEEEGDARGEPRAARSAATRFPKDWELTEDRRAYATAQGIDASATFENFRDYWTAASGAKARKHDWDATWRMWCRNQSERKTQADRPRKTRYAQLTERLEARINGE